MNVQKVSVARRHVAPVQLDQANGKSAVDNKGQAAAKMQRPGLGQGIDRMQGTAKAKTSPAPAATPNQLVVEAAGQVAEAQATGKNALEAYEQGVASWNRWAGVPGAFAYGRLSAAAAEMRYAKKIGAQATEEFAKAATNYQQAGKGYLKQGQRTKARQAFQDAAANFTRAATEAHYVGSSQREIQLRGAAARAKAQAAQCE